jgi:drug/metabolite transporter (DMT)-like permease
MSAVVFWSFGSSLVYLGAKEAGTWPFVALACLAGGVLQLIFRKVHQGELRTAFWLPWRLWAVPVTCFVAYGLVWPLALASASPRQVFGVSLINYLWPVLTVLFSVWWVPGVHLSGRTVLALLLALAGLSLANLEPIRDLLSTGDRSAGPLLPQFLPYALALVAAVTWAVYSAVLVRWRGLATGYVTSPIGFLLLGVIGAGVSSTTGSLPVRMSASGRLLTLLYGIGPLAAGYLLWELALPRAKVQTLSLVAAITPILSTMLLCLFLKTMPGIELILAALLVSSGVVLSMKE